MAGGHRGGCSVEVLDFSTSSAVWTESEYGLILIIIIIDPDYHYQLSYQLIEKGSGSRGKSRFDRKMS